MSSEDSLPKPAAAIADELVNFSQEKLKATQTQEKVVLPSKEDIEAEKGHNEMVDSIQKFDSKSLKHTETQEKNVLPTAEVIEQEKKEGGQ